MKRHVTMELGVIGPIVMVNVSRLEQGKGFYFQNFGSTSNSHWIWYMLHVTCSCIAACNILYKLSREIKMDQIKNLRSVNARNYVFIMFQMISIWNWQHVPSTQADQSETYKNNQWNDLLVEQQRSLVLFHMLSDWYFKHLINFILIPRFDPSLNASWYLTFTSISKLF